MVRKQTPWGPAQDTTVIAEGIVSYSTAGHGGIWLSAERWQRVEKLWPLYKTFTGKQWLEEDQDWAIAALAFPEHFTDQDLRAAIKTAQYSCKWTDHPDVGWKQVSDWIESLDGAEIRQRVGKWISDNAANWERGSSGSAPPGFNYPLGWASYNRIGDGASQSIVEKPHDWKHVYTDADLDEIRVATLKHYGQEVA